MQKPDAPAGHAVGLREREYAYDARARLGDARRREQLRVVVEKILVHLVADDEQIVTVGDLDQALDLRPRIDGARRVVGVREQHGDGLARDRALESAQVESKVLFLDERHETGSTAGDANRLHVRGIARRRDQDLAARLHGSEERRRDRLDRSAGDDDLGLRIVLHAAFGDRLGDRFA